jgi:hypothetical protein
MVLHIPQGGGVIASGTRAWTFMSREYPLAVSRRRSPLGAEVVTAVCLRPRFPPLHFPFPVAHVVCVFPGFLPSSAAAFLGPQQTFLLVICRSALLRDAVFFRAKIVGGEFIFRLWKFGLFVLCLCTFVQYWVFILVPYGPRGIEESNVLFDLSICCVCIIPMVSFKSFLSIRVSDGEF